MAILCCLLDAKKLDVREQLSLALAWDRPDVAARKILSDNSFAGRLSREREGGGLGDFVNDLLATALVQDQVEFVKVLIDHGVSVESFLTVGRLRSLYNDAARRCPFTWPLLAARGIVELGHDLSLSAVHSLIKSFTRRFNDPVYRDDSLYTASKRVTSTSSLRIELDNCNICSPLTENSDSLSTNCSSGLC